jgi:hypothetical protein
MEPGGVRIQLSFSDRRNAVIKSPKERPISGNKRPISKFDNKSSRKIARIGKNSDL